MNGRIFNILLVPSPFKAFCGPLAFLNEFTNKPLHGNLEPLWCHPFVLAIKAHQAEASPGASFCLSKAICSHKHPCLAPNFNWNCKLATHSLSMGHCIDDTKTNVLSSRSHPMPTAPMPRFLGVGAIPPKEALDGLCKLLLVDLGHLWNRGVEGNEGD